MAYFCETCEGQDAAHASRAVTDGMRRVSRRLRDAASGFGLPAEVGWPVNQLRGSTTVEAWIDEERRRLPIYEWPRSSAIAELEPPTVRWIGPPPPTAGELAPYFQAEAMQVYPRLWVARLSRPSLGRGRLLSLDGRRLSIGGTAQPRLWYTRPGTPLKGAYLSLCGLWTGGYAHWVLDVLPKLELFSGINDGAIPVLVDGPLARWQLESLAMFGISADRVIPVTALVRPEWAYVVGPIGTPSNCHPRAASFLRTVVRSTSGERRIYVSRSRAARRRVLNEDELTHLFRQHKFDVVNAEEMSFKRQVELFSEARFVVAPHGAGLANLAFAPVECSVIELMPAERPQLSYWALSSLLGLKYDVLPCKSSGAANDIYVEPGAIESAIEAL